MTYALQVVTNTSRRGAESFAVEVADRLRSLGRDARLVALSPGEGDTLNVAPLAQNRWRALPPLRALVQHAAVVIGHGSSTLPACAVAALGTGVPFVYRNIGSPTFWAGSRAKRTRVRLALRRTARVAALWEGSKRELVEYFGVPPDRIRVVPNARSAASFPVVTPDARDAARSRYGVRHDGPVAVYLGALSAEKGLDTGLRSLAFLKDVHIVVAGAGPREGDLRRLADEVCPGQVTWLGSTRDPASVLALADVVVLPSRTEGLPGVAIEAGLSGLAVVATDVGGTSEIIVDGRTGALVRPGDPEAFADGLRRAIADAPGMGLAARARCMSRFELGPVVEKWAALLDEVARSPW